MATPIFLIGYMGSGKSTIGRHMARLLDYRFIDTDHYIETRWRERITDTFARSGEATFRRRERLVIEELMTMTDTIFATGGGLPCQGDTMDLLLAEGTVVYLRCGVDVLTSRLELCKRTRPTIKDKSGQELRDFIESSLRERRPIYERAQVIVDIDHIITPRDEARLARELIDQLALLPAR